MKTDSILVLATDQAWKHRTRGASIEQEGASIPGQEVHADVGLGS